MTTQLCGARYRHNMSATCGKQPGHLDADPVHKVEPTDPATLEWFDHDTYQTSVPDLLGALQGAVDRARADRRTDDS